MVVAHIDELSQFFTVSFLSKDELDEHTLLNATHKISAEAMKGWLAKEIFQEEIYCRLTAKDIKQGAYDPSLRRAMMEVFGRIPDVDNVRIMKLMATRENHQKFPKSTPHLEGRRIRGLNVGGWVGIGGEMQRSSGIDEPDALVVWESILAQATGRRGSKRKREHEVGDVGYSFRKWFDAGWFEGKVTEILPEALDGRDRRCVYSDGDAENLSVEELRALARADRPAKKPKAAKRKRRTKKVVSDESASDDADQIEAGAAEDIEMAGASADAADAVDAAESESEREGGEESSEPEMLSLAARAADEEATPSRTRAAEGREADDTPEAIPAEARKETRNEAVAEAPARSPKAPRRRKKAKSTMEDDASALEEQIAAEVSASERKTRSSKARADKKDMSGAADAPKGRGASTKTPEAAEESRRRTNSSRAKQAAATEDDGAQAKDEGRKAHRGSSKGRDKSANALELEEDASSGGGKAGESRDTRSRGARKEADEEEQPVVNAHDGDFGGDGGFEVEAEMGGAGGAPGPGAIEGAGSIPAPSTILVGASTAGGGGTLDAAPGEAGSPRQHVEAVELADEGSVGEEHEEVGERPEDEEDDDVTEERLEGASDGAPAPPPLAKAAPTPPRPAHRRKKKDAGGVQLFAFRSPESGTETAAGPSTPGAASDRRPKRKLKSIARYSDSNPHAKPPKGEGYKHGEGFLCPRCGHVCSYDARVCEDCHLECYYEAGVGVVTLRERRANEPEAKKQTRAGRKEVGKGEGRGREAGEKRGVKRGSLKGRPSKTDGKTGENKAPTEDADVKDDETDTESSSSEDASGEHRAVGAGEEKTKSAGEKKPARKKSRARGGETTAKQSAPRAVPRRGAAIKAASKLSRDMSEEDSGSDGDSFAFDETSLAGSADESNMEDGEYESDSSGTPSKQPSKSNQKRSSNQGAQLKANKHNERWDEHFDQLKEYSDEHGDCNVPQSYAKSRQLGKWVARQRQAFKNGKLLEERRVRLNELGFHWTVVDGGVFKANDEQWNKRLEQLQAYKAEHRDCNVPKRYAKNPQLGMWVSEQRKKHKNGKLPGDRIQRLNELGFHWTVVDGGAFKANDEQWNERLGQLQSYNHEHGHCNVPQRCAKNPQLGQWVMVQRRSYKNGKISNERRELLEEIGFRF